MTDFTIQGLYSADDQLKFAIIEIDKQMGKGFSKKNPGLVGSFMLAAAQNSATERLSEDIAKGFDDLAGTLANAIYNHGSKIADAMPDKE